MFDPVTAVRLAMRRRIVADAGIVTPENYQRDCFNAPEGAELYIRETVMESDRRENSQTSELITVLCEYDVFARRDASSDPLAAASETASALLAEFNPKNPAKVDLVSADLARRGAWAWISRMSVESADLEEELLRLPVLIYVEVHAPASAYFTE